MSSSGITLSERLARAVAEVRAEYLSKEHSCPWVLGFSGGKDSTLVAQIVFEALLKIPPSQRTRKITILSNDTLVESPLLAQHLVHVLDRIQKGAEALDLPIETTVTRPELDQTFWVNLIGRGYPAPNRQFRWCTDRMKIQPTSNFIREQISAAGEVILLLGVRTSESSTRAATTRRHTVEGSRLHPHTDLRGCLVFRPILDFATEEVWQLLLQRPAPWGGSHRDLVTLYRNAEGGECPLVLDNEAAPSCGTGSSRFGCWTCTVVTKDKSMEGLIDGGHTVFEPLLEFRDWLQIIRDHPDYRERQRRNGTPGVGPFSLEARKKILDRLLTVQSSVGWQLISEEEIGRIRDIWADDLIVKAQRLFNIVDQEEWVVELNSVV